MMTQSPKNENREPKTCIIAAMAENRVIGLHNDIPWYIPEDFQHFKAVTMGKPCIMGRKTYESILQKLGKPLPGRTSIVISRSGYTHEGAQSAGSLEDAIKMAKDIAQKDGQSEIMVIGGAQIYELALPLADRLYLTRVHAKYEGDAFFPAFDENDWEDSAWEDRDSFSFHTLER